MGATTEVTVTSAAWVQVGAAGEQVLITPVNPDHSYLVRYKNTDPGADVTTGHIFYRKDDIPNAILGSPNTEAPWIRLVTGSDQVAILTVL